MGFMLYTRPCFSATLLYMPSKYCVKEIHDAFVDDVCLGGMAASFLTCMPQSLNFSSLVGCLAVLPWGQVLGVTVTARISFQALLNPVIT